jgi:CPA2 family monovalent cation:H+ antiporter-2
MEQPGSLALTLLISLAAALLLGALAHRLRLAPMIGYIGAGLIVGPFTPGFVADREQLLGLADIGVALLMFSIGVQFKLRELAAIGWLVIAGAPIQVAASLGLGTGAALLFGASPITALFLGAVGSVCSSVVLVKVAGEEMLHASRHGRIAIGWSVAQDLITVVLVVVLGALAEQSDAPLLDAVRATAVAAAFVIGAVLVGSRVLPAILAWIARLGSRELFIVAVAVLAIGTAFSASLVGVSVALGAFVAGLAISESDLSASVLGEIVPLRELFATLFFVSVGLLLEPAAVLAGWPVVLAMLVLIVLGKGLPIAAIGAAWGERPPTAFRVGGLLAQAGEFSFVLAALGLQAGALDSGTFSQAMGAVVLSIVLAGPLAAASGWVGDRLDRVRRPEAVDVAGTVFAAREAGALERHTVILGYGRVGRTVARVLEGRGFRYVAIDVDYPLVRGARDAGFPIVYGDAGRPAVLDEAGIAAARALIVALPDALAARQAVTYALRRNPHIEVMARAHSESDEAELRRMGVGRVVLAEQEVGNELVRHALRRYGISERELDAIVRRAR